MRTIVLAIIILSSVFGFTVSCSTSQSTGGKQVSFANTRWGLKTLNGKKVEFPQNGREVFVLFKQYDTKFNGFAGCNTINGEYVANIDGTMKISGIITTLMACDLSDTETAFIQALESADTYKISGYELTLYAKRKAVAKLYAVYLR